MKNKLQRCLLSIISLIAFTTVWGQQSVISGKISDVAGEPVSGASISASSGSGTTSDAKGMFRLSLDLSSPVTLTISNVGYKTIVKTIAAGDNQPINVVLEEDRVGLNTVVVTATSSPRRTQQIMPLSITTYNETRLEQIKYNSNADVLRGVPGITAENGGGEVASNIFVRGLPSGGQYQFTPLQMDGMPVISTMGLTSSAPDVYFRNDLGISRLEFVRGGSATLYGAGSVAGIVNFTSKVGTETPKSVIETEWASPGKARVDFNTGGPLSNNRLYYNLTGMYRYDNGPIRTGIPSNGYQFRGNVRKITDNGSFTLYAQYINDQVQFYSPYHLTKDRTIPKGWNGEDINTMETPDVANLTAKTPNGFYQSRAGNAVSTKGSYIMADFQHNFGNDWRLGVKLRTANYKHEFNFFNTDGNGRNPLTQAAFLSAVAPTGTNPVYTYASDNTALPSNALILENIIVDRNRPLNEIAAQGTVTKTLQGKAGKHVVTVGSFLSRTNSVDYNVQLRYLSEYHDRPRILNLTYTNATGAPTNYTTNGVVSVPGYANKDLTSSRAAVYLTDEMSIGKWNIDAGVRVENHVGRIVIEKTSSAANADGRTVAWGNGSFDRFNLQATDWAAAVGVSYQVQKELNVYGNFSRGYFFPEYRGYSVKYKSGIPVYPEEKPEHITQGEVGAKFGNRDITATVAGYYVSLKDRWAVNLVTIGGVLRETQNIQSSEAYGVEFTYDWQFVKSFHLLGTGTFQHATYTKYVDSSTATPIDNEGKWLERQPQVMMSPSLVYDNKKFYASFGIDYVSKRYGNAANLVELDPYTLARIDLAYRFPLKNDETVRIAAGVFNLFDSEAVTEGNPRAGNTQTNTGDYFVGRVSLPRAVYVRLGLSF